MARRVYMLALTVETAHEEPDLDDDMILDEVVENTVGFSTAREAIDEGLGGATHPARLIGLMVIGRIPTYEEGT